MKKSGDGFFEKVYALVRTVPAGKVVTYGQIAAALNTTDARRVGHALHGNPYRDCPCHRVVFADGSMAPGYAFGGPKEQLRRLEEEGVVFTQIGKVNLTKCLWHFPQRVTAIRI